MALRRAVFLDKDGTLVENVPYNVDLRDIRLAPGSQEALARFAAGGFRLFVVSNQSGVAHGYFPECRLREVESHLRGVLSRRGISLDGFYYCPHHPKGAVPDYSLVCSCRKPEPGLIVRAGEEHGIDLAGSWVIGDILDDIEAAHRAGCRAVLIDNGGETRWKLSPARVPEYVAKDLSQAARFITSQLGVVVEAAAGEAGSR